MNSVLLCPGDWSLFSGNVKAQLFLWPKQGKKGPKKLYNVQRGRPIIISKWLLKEPSFADIPRKVLYIYFTPPRDPSNTIPSICTAPRCNIRLWRVVDICAHSIYYLGSAEVLSATSAVLTPATASTWASQPLSWARFVFVFVSLFVFFFVSFLSLSLHLFTFLMLKAFDKLDPGSVGACKTTQCSGRAWQGPTCCAGRVFRKNV